MKRKGRGVVYALSALLLCGAPLIITGCGEGNSDNVGPGPVVNDKKVSAFTVTLSSDKDVSVGQTVQIITKVTSPSDAKGKFTYTVKEGSEKFVEVNVSGLVTAKEPGEATIIVKCNNMDNEANSTKEVKVTVVGEAKNAKGAFNYVAAPYEERLEILGKMEKYAVDNHLTGITLFQNGGYVMYNPRIEKGSNTYISGYGFGILTEGKIKGPLKGAEPGEQYYLHQFGGTTNKGKFNYLDDQGSESGSLYGYISSGFYGTKMNTSKNGYEYYPVLAKKAPDNVVSDLHLSATQAIRPIALNKDPATGLATEYKVYVKTGKDGLKYGTLSTKYSEFNGRGVALEDYITPYKVLLNQKIGLARGIDMISDSSNGTLKGAKAYYNITKNDSNIENTSKAFEQMVGIEKNEEEGSLKFTFNTPVNEFNAMINLSSNLTSPFPAEFIKAIAPDKSPENVYQSGMKNAYGVACEQTKTTPVDNLLSLAPYTLEYSASQKIKYKRNPNWIEFSDKDPSISGRNSIEGIVLVYLQASQQDPLAAFNAFQEQEKLDSVAIPKDRLSLFKNDPRTTTTQGDSTFKLNINSTNKDEWESIFGTEGSNPNGGTKYAVKPLMSNDDFLDALSFSIDRKTFAANRGNIPSQSYFAPAYLWEPEKGYSYDDTPEHKAAIAQYSPETYGYSVEVATKLFDKAIQDEINKGSYPGFKSTETIEISWMNPTDSKDFGDELLTYFNKAFSKTEAYKKGFKINFTQDNGSTDYQAVYTKMRKGTYDLGFGSISGMQLDPLGFLETLKTNNVTGFTLSYGRDTSKITYETPEDEDGFIVYDNKKWSFDSLWEAACKGVIIGDDTKPVAKPLEITQAGTGSIESEMTIGGKSVAARQISLQYVKDLQAVSTSMKFRTNDKESLVLSFTYNKTSEEKANGSLTIDFGDNFVIGNENAETFEISNDRSGNYIDILIPATFSPETTNNAFDTTFKYTDIIEATISINYYITINGVTTSQSLSIPVSF